MYKISVGSMGMRPDDFWNMTMGELILAWRGNYERSIRAFNDNITIARQAVYWVKYTKELPALADILIDPDKKEEHEEQEMTPDQTLAFFRVLNAQYGGKVVET